MASQTITMVRIYLTEADDQLAPLLRQLHDEENVKGVTAFRGIAGFGGSGKMHSAHLLDLSLNLPVIVEFFDEPDKATAIIEHLEKSFAPGHIVHWPALMNC